MKKCEDLMNSDLRWISSEASALEVSRMMRNNSLGFLPICDTATGKLVGVITDRDLVTRMCAADLRPSEIQVADLLTPRPAVCQRGDDVAAAEEVMMSRDIARVVIVDEESHPIGVLSLTDLIMHERSGRAVRTARGVLAREAGGPHAPIESVRLTPSDPNAAPPPHPELSAQEIHESSATARTRDDYIVGGGTRGSFKEFPG